MNARANKAKASEPIEDFISIKGMAKRRYKPLVS